LPTVRSVFEDDRITKAVRYFLERNMLVTSPMVTDKVLKEACKCLEMLNNHAVVFVDYGVTDLKFNKWHCMTRFLRDIEENGTIDSFNTETSERQHILDAKGAFHTSNHRDAATGIACCN
jgi:hypothetical protein